MVSWRFGVPRSYEENLEKEIEKINTALAMFSLASTPKVGKAKIIHYL